MISDEGGKAGKRAGCCARETGGRGAFAPALRLLVGAGIRPRPPRRSALGVWAVVAGCVAGNVWGAEPESEPPLPDLPRTQQPVEAREPVPEVDGAIAVSPLVTRLIADPITSEDERRRLRVFHGRWEGLDEAALPVGERAVLALLRYELDHASLRDAAVDPLLRAEAALLRGEPAEAVALLEGRGDVPGAAAAVLRSRAFEQLGRLGEALAELRRVRARLAAQELRTAEELTAAADAMAAIARLEGSSAAHYGTVMQLLTRVRDEVDPLHWPARVAEARLLVEKDNRAEGGPALLEALSLNPKAGEPWYRLGGLALDGYDFERAAICVAKLREVNPTHPLADRLEARARLQQRDVAGARAIVEPALALMPESREWLALLAAVEAMSYDEAATEATLAALDRLAPGSPEGHFVAGSYLSGARQYAWGTRLLGEAVRRQPNWAAPHVELGLLLMQDGDLEAAREALSSAARLDPFHRRANNQLTLVEEMLGYERIETDHFIVRYQAGIDAALARDMPQELERIYAKITAAFDFEPARKTQIDIMPDERYFGVRITGMPDIWTIAASSGDVIALTPPREGPHHRGPYNWANVLGHEFVHTVTLGKTNNRLPHWFTEACAVSQETTGRTWDQCQLLAWAYHEDKLFDLDTINWGFVRPKTERDRPLAYAQAAWMLEYIAETHDWDAVLQLLTLYADGVADAEANRRVTGQTQDEFLDAFKAWAGEHVVAWGLGRPTTSERLGQVLSDERETASEDELASLLAEHPDHPDLLKLLAERAMKRAGDAAAAREAVERYAAVRPIDPWSHRSLVKLAADAGDLAAAMPSLEALDRVDNESAAWAAQLAELHRAAGRLDEAQAAIGRAILREPYNASFRTTAATLALRRGEADLALRQLEAIGAIEPDRAQHQVRLAALYQRLGRPGDAKRAAEAARALDPAAPVDAFLP